LEGIIFHKFVRNFTHICKKILQICVKLGKSCLVGLGEFSPNGQMFSFGSSSKMTKVSQIFSCESCVLILTKNGLGHILGDFFINSSGHADRKRGIMKWKKPFAASVPVWPDEFVKKSPKRWPGPF
jgi:hypothetical protein